VLTLLRVHQSATQAVLHSDKQYSKEEYLTLLPQIRAHMEKSDEWGMFFPIDLSPFAYNETMAQQDFPLKEDGRAEVRLAMGDESQMTTGKETIAWEKIPPAHSRMYPIRSPKKSSRARRAVEHTKIILQELAFP